MQEPITSDNKVLHIYTDGACSGNPGPGGWGAVMLYNGIRKELAGYAPSTTNNRMEMTAPISALNSVKTNNGYSCDFYEIIGNIHDNPELLDLLGDID